MMTAPAFGAQPLVSPHFRVPGCTPRCPMWPPPDVCCHLRLKSHEVKLSKAKHRAGGSAAPPTASQILAGRVGLGCRLCAGKFPRAVPPRVCGGRSGNAHRAVLGKPAAPGRRPRALLEVVVTGRGAGTCVESPWERGAVRALALRPQHARSVVSVWPRASSCLSGAPGLRRLSPGCSWLGGQKDPATPPPPHRLHPRCLQPCGRSEGREGPAENTRE